MGSFTTIHNFAELKQLSYKVTPFQSTVEEIRHLGTDFVSFMKNEMERGSGELVDAINQEIVDQHRNHNLILDHCVDTLTAMANTYTNYVNDRRTQDVTIYYTYTAFDES